MYDLTNSDKQLLQSTINSGVRRLKDRKRALGTEHCAGHLCKDRCVSGQAAIQKRIDQLHSIKDKLGITLGYSQQPGSPYLDNSDEECIEAIPLDDLLDLDESVVLFI